MNLILTGSRGAGKTTICLSVAEMARAGQRTVGGVVCPATFDAEGRKSGFDAVDLASQERWLLGRFTAFDEDSSRIGPYSLSSTGMARCLAVMNDAFSLPPDLVFVDEIGPLELVRGEGFAPVMESLPLDGPGHLLVVVRPSLVPLFMQTLDRRDWLIFAAREDNRSSLPDRISQVLWHGD